MNVTYTNESCHMYEWVRCIKDVISYVISYVASNKVVSHVTYVNESCHMYE